MRQNSSGSTPRAFSRAVRSHSSKGTAPSAAVRLHQLRHRVRAIKLRLRAARMKAAAARKAPRLGTLPGIAVQTFRSSAQLRHRVHQRLGVGMQRAAQQSPAGASSTICPAYITATRSAMSPTMPRLCVMSSMAMPRRCLRSSEQFDDLRLDRHVERGGRFVGDEQLGLRRQRHRDHHALLHAAGKLVRIIADARFRRRNADELQQANHFVVGGLLRPMQFERFLDLIADAKDRIQRRAGFLKNIADHAAADLPQLGLATSSSTSRPFSRISPPA